MQRGNGEMSSGSCWGSAAPFPQTGRPGRRSGSGTVCAAFIWRGRGIGRWLRRSLADLLLLTAAEHHGTAADLEECLTAAEALPLPGMADWLAVYRRQGCPPVHHSPAYREAYDPHYRVLRTAYGGYFPHCWRRPGWRGAADQPSWPLTAAAAAARAAWET